MEPFARSRSGNSTRSFPRRDGSSTIPNRSSHPRSQLLSKPSPNAKSGPAKSPPSASPISERPRSCGIATPAADLQRHCLAGPPHRRLLRAPPQRRACSAHPAAHRPAHRLVFFGQQDLLDSRPRLRRSPRSPKPANSPSARSTAGSSGNSPSGRVHVDRRQQRLPHHALQYSHRVHGITNYSICFAIPISMMPAVRSSSEDLWRSERLARPRRNSDRGHRRGSAGRALRSALHPSRHDQKHLRHRMLHAAEHWPARRAFFESPA